MALLCYMWKGRNDSWPVYGTKSLCGITISQVQCRAHDKDTFVVKTLVYYIKAQLLTLVNAFSENSLSVSDFDLSLIWGVIERSPFVKQVFWYVRKRKGRHLFFFVIYYTFLKTRVSTEYLGKSFFAMQKESVKSKELTLWAGEKRNSEIARNSWFRVHFCKDVYFCKFVPSCFIFLIPCLVFIHKTEM